MSGALDEQPEPAGPDVRRRGPDGLRAADRAMQILFALAEQPSGMSLADLTRATGLTLTTVHRMIGTLRAKRLTRETSDGLQALGPGTLILARGFLGGLDFRVEALPVLSELRDATEEACHLATLASPHVVYVDKLDSRHAVRVTSRIGATAPAVTTALGRALLAYLPRDVVGSVLAASSSQLGLEVDRGAFDDLLETVRARGYSIDRAESQPGVFCVGAPVFDGEGEVIAAVSVSIPSIRFEADREPAAGALVRASADRISRALGHQQGDRVAAVAR